MDRWKVGRAPDALRLQVVEECIARLGIEAIAQADDVHEPAARGTVWRSAGANDIVREGRQGRVVLLGHCGAAGQQRRQALQLGATQRRREFAHAVVEAEAHVAHLTVIGAALVAK